MRIVTQNSKNMSALSLKEFYNKYGTGCANSREQVEQIWNAATKYTIENIKLPPCCDRDICDSKDKCSAWQLHKAKS